MQELCANNLFHCCTFFVLVYQHDKQTKTDRLPGRHARICCEEARLCPSQCNHQTAKRDPRQNGQGAYHADAGIPYQGNRPHLTPPAHSTFIPAPAGIFLLQCFFVWIMMILSGVTNQRKTMRSRSEISAFFNHGSEILSVPHFGSFLAWVVPAPHD